MRHIVLFCLLSTGAQATIQNVSILGSTATQALIHYTAPNNSPCTVEVSESPTYLPLVNDVDGTKFASASSDSRPGAITNGAERLFVVGKRAAEVGLDTVRYSRALQTATQHYFRITCPSTGDQAAGTFQTTSIPFGASYLMACGVLPGTIWAIWALWTASRPRYRHPPLLYSWGSQVTNPG